jgi:peptidoglycan/xylan/chitin deacetylase (PgdA/CDA1 family)
MASDKSLSRRLRNRWRRFTTERYGRRDFRLESDTPYVSFTFDDFPRTAFTEGGRILSAHGARGTYFVSFDLVGGPSVSGPIASHDEVVHLVREGHELGCHTFEHLDGTRASADAFERSITANRAALHHHVPGQEFSVFAYPLDGPVLNVKRAVGKHFIGCRGGGQTFNRGRMDLNLLKAYFLDWRNRGNLDVVRAVIEQNVAERGWLIFATHDVASAPSKYGCEPEFFDQVVRLAVQSGARVRTMAQACAELRIAG